MNDDDNLFDPSDIDESPMDENPKNDKKDPKDGGKKSSNIKKGFQLTAIATVVLAGAYVMFGGTEPTAQPVKTVAANVPVNQSSAPVEKGSDVEETEHERKARQFLQTKRLPEAKEMGTYESRSLETVNKDEDVFSAIEQLKQAVRENRRLAEDKGRSTASLRAEQEIIFKSVVQLHKLTSSQEVSLEDGSIITPQDNGSSFSITSSSDIVNQVNKGTFIILPNGYVLVNKELSTTYFVFSNPANESEVANMFMVTPMHGLKEVTSDKAIVNQVMSLTKQTDTDQVVVHKYRDSVISFNEFGEIASVKKYIKEVMQDEMSQKINADTVRMLSGFDTKNHTKYRVNGSAIFKGSRAASFENQTTDLSLRYAEYRTSKTEEPLRIVEVVNINDRVLKRFPISSIKRVYLSSSKDNQGKEYIERGGEIYTVDNLGNEELQGKGKIIGNIDNGILQQEKIYLQESSIRMNELSAFAGKVLTGTSGKVYSVEKDYAQIYPTDEIVATSDYLLSSVGKLILKAGMKEVDAIETVKNKTKIGGRIISENYIVEIKSLDRASVFDKKRLTTKIYLNPEISFPDDEFIEIYAAADHNHNADDKTIGGTPYAKKVETTPGVYNFYDDRGNLINPERPEYNFNKILVLKERVEDVEKIEGDAFEYLYRINVKTGEVYAEGIGKLMVKNDADLTAKAFNAIEKEVELSSKENDIKSKTIFSIDDMMNQYPHLPKIKFKMRNEDELIITSPTSILMNGKKVTIDEGKYNTELGLFVFVVPNDLDTRIKKELTGAHNINRFERTVRSITNDAPNYYNDTITVSTLPTQTKVVGIREQGSTIWTSVYDERVNLKSNTIELTIKPYRDTGVSSEKISVDLSTINVMSETMKNDMISQYQLFANKQQQRVAAPSKNEMKEINNVKILEAELASLKKEMDEITGKNLALQTFKMSPEELAVVEAELDKNESSFNFDIGTTLTYEIEKSVEVVEGTDHLIYTALDQKFLEDREGNQLNMVDPIVVLKVTGDFNTNKVKFFPVQIVFTDEERQRQILNIPDTSTVNEYSDESTDEKLDGVPAYYVNQRVANLGTTVMLSSVQGVVESMTTPDDGFGGALAGLTDTTTTEQDAFTDGVASGASEGIQEILDAMKEKSEGKKDLLITTGGLKVSSVFVITTPAAGK